MTEREALDLVADDDYEPESRHEAADLFAAVFGRPAEDEDGDQLALWSAVCDAAKVRS